MSLDLVLRIVGGIAFATIGWHVEEALQGHSPNIDATLVVSLSLSGFIFGLLLTPQLTVRPFVRFTTYISSLSDAELFGATLGLVVALVMSALAALPLSLLPGYIGKVSPLALAVVFAYFGVKIGVDRRRLLEHLRYGVDSGGAQGRVLEEPVVEQNIVLLDTSVIIDGRIVGVSRTGFLPGTIVVPRFVLDELQQLSDSSDARRRTSGRHGFDVLRELREKSVVPVEIREFDGVGDDEVDRRLVKLARKLDCPILTTDWNLNKVAELQGVPVLNLNLLSDALRPVLAMGDHLKIRLIEQGGQPGQARGYLDDGTMVVVENGQHMIGKDTRVVVQRIRQQETGRIVFAVPHLGEHGAA